MQVSSFEKEALVLLCEGMISKSALDQAISSPDSISCEFTGAGYYLEIQHHALPKDRMVCDKPTVLGKYQDQEVGFIAFVQDNRITLECYEYDSNGVPEEIRNEAVQVYAT